MNIPEKLPAINRVAVTTAAKVNNFDVFIFTTLIR
jgi:hypothetical protein